MNKRVRVCDRCGKSIKEFPSMRIQRVKQVWILGFGPYDYHDRTDELCAQCTKEHDAFMKGAE